MNLRELFAQGYKAATKGEITVERKHHTVWRVWRGEDYPVTSTGTDEGLIRIAERDHGVDGWEPKGNKYHAARYIISSHVWVPAEMFMFEHGPHCICDGCHAQRPHSEW